MSELLQTGYSQKKLHDARKYFTDITHVKHDKVSWAFFGPKNVDRVQRGLCEYVKKMAQQKGKDYTIDRQSDREIVRIMISMFVEHYMHTNVPQINRSGLNRGCSEKYTRMPQAFLFSDKSNTYDPPVGKKYARDGTMQEDYEWKIPVVSVDSERGERMRKEEHPKIGKINEAVQDGRCDAFWQQKHSVKDQVKYINNRVISFIGPQLFREVENYLMFIHDSNTPYRLLDTPIYSSTNNTKSVELTSYYSGENTRPHLRTCSTNRVLTDALPEEYGKQGIDYLELNKLQRPKEFKAFDFKKQWGCPSRYGNTLN